MFTNIISTLARVTGIRYVSQPLDDSDEDDAVVLDIVGYRQLEEDTCGAVAGMMVLHTFDPDADSSSWFSELEPNQNGVASRRLVDALRAWDVSVAYRRKMNLRQLERFLDDGCPVILVIERSGPEDLHWVVAYGYDSKYVYLAGEGLPYVKETRLPIKKFMKVWTREGLACWTG